MKINSGFQCYMYICTFVHVSLCVYFCLSLYMSVCLYVCVLLCLCQHAYRTQKKNHIHSSFYSKQHSSFEWKKNHFPS